MKTWEKLLIAGVLLVGVLCLMQTQAKVDRNWDATYATAHEVLRLSQDVEVAAQIIDLPETGQAWHLSVFVDPDWQQKQEQAAVVSWFSTEPRLARLRSETHDHLYTTEDPLYKTRYVASVPKVPAVMLQDAAGRVHYKVGTTEPIPPNGRAMADDIGRIFNKFPRPFCPKPKPDEPKPDEVKPDNTNLPVIPDVTPRVAEPVQFGFPLWTVLLVAGGLGFVGMLIAGAVSLFYNIKQHR